MSATEPSRNRDSRTHNNLTIPHHLRGKVSLPMQPKPTQKPTVAREIFLPMETLRLLSICSSRAVFRSFIKDLKSFNK